MISTPAKKITYLALGDSYTIGEGLSFSERFPAILAEELKKKSIETSPDIIAATGWTTTDLKKGIASAAIGNKNYDIVSLLIGANNHYQRRSIEEYKTEFKELLLQAIHFTGENKNKALVISIPDYGYTPFGQSNQEAISEGINVFNAANRYIADSMGVKYIDINAISRKGITDSELLTADGLHPSGKMYRQWVDLMLKDVIYIINNP